MRPKPTCLVVGSTWGDPFSDLMFSIGQRLPDRWRAYGAYHPVRGSLALIWGTYLVLGLAVLGASLLAAFQPAPALALGAFVMVFASGAVAFLVGLNANKPDTAEALRKSLENETLRQGPS